MAEALIGIGDRAAAAAPLNEAAAVARRLGARPLLADIESLASRARIDVGAAPSPASAASAASGHGLTTREMEVLRLVVEGRSNSDIAGELFISVKTASVHVSNIMRKLGAGSRGEAAAVAHRLKLIE